MNRTVALSESQLREIREAFVLFDTKKSGSLDGHECQAALRALGFDFALQEVLEMTAPASGHIVFDTFAAVASTLVAQRDPVTEIREAFALFDEAGTGYVTVANLRKIARKLGEPLNEAELEAMISEFDTNGDGVISEAEFVDLMRQSFAFT